MHSRLSSKKIRRLNVREMDGLLCVRKFWGYYNVSPGSIWRHITIFVKYAVLKS
eukprot:TRINITY_DN17574_c0_g1_i1.p1 TRINITY_DN17574_c0_g1~~TRINITY_DN17574_c0_g1_i1.p1  ORF type:complete len:54 (-),score=2.44 TRINITY_DN17574_c0_g1_i1:102-263(-)